MACAYKIIPDEFPAFQKLRPTPVSGHIPAWRERLSADAAKAAASSGQEPPPQPEPGPTPTPEPEPAHAPESQTEAREQLDEPEPRFDYDFTDDEGLGMVEKAVSSVLGEDEPEDG